MFEICATGLEESAGFHTHKIRIVSKKKIMRRAPTPKATLQISLIIGFSVDGGTGGIKGVHTYTTFYVIYIYIKIILNINIKRSMPIPYPLPYPPLAKNWLFC